MLAFGSLYGHHFCRKIPPLDAVSAPVAPREGPPLRTRHRVGQLPAAPGTTLDTVAWTWAPLWGEILPRGARGEATDSEPTGTSPGLPSRDERVKGLASIIGCCLSVYCNKLWEEEIVDEALS